MILFVRNLVVKDLWLKLFSLVFAVLIWFTVDISLSKDVSPWTAIIGHTADEMVMTTPVRVPGNLRDVKVDPDHVEVTLRGDPKLLEELKQRPGDVRALVNLNDVQSANGLLCPVELILPQGVFYTHIDHERVEVRLSTKAQ
jgi:hypothetical protein